MEGLEWRFVWIGEGPEPIEMQMLPADLHKFLVSQLEDEVVSHRHAQVEPRPTARAVGRSRPLVSR